MRTLIIIICNGELIKRWVMIIRTPYLIIIMKIILLLGTRGSARVRSPAIESRVSENTTFYPSRHGLRVSLPESWTSVFFFFLFLSFFSTRYVLYPSTCAAFAIVRRNRCIIYRLSEYSVLAMTEYPTNKIAFCFRGVLLDVKRGYFCRRQTSAIVLFGPRRWHGSKIRKEKR